MQGYQDYVPGRRMYEALPIDVRERNQTRIPSPGHKVTYHEHFGLIGDMIQRPPENMKEWLSRNYSKEQKLETVEILHERSPVVTEQVIYEVQPVEFRVLPQPVVHHEFVFHEPRYEQVVIREEVKFLHPQVSESPQKIEETKSTEKEEEVEVNISFGEKNDINKLQEPNESQLRKPYSPN